MKELSFCFKGVVRRVITISSAYTFFHKRPQYSALITNHNISSKYFIIIIHQKRELHEDFQWELDDEDEDEISQIDLPFGYRRKNRHLIWELDEILEWELHKDIQWELDDEDESAVQTDLLSEPRNKIDTHVCDTIL